MGRKLRRDAVLKKLESAQRKQVLEWLEQDGEESARQRILSELHIASPQDPAKPVSRQTLYDAVNYWAAQEITDEMFSFRDAQADLFKQFRPDDAKLAREFGEFALLQRANKSQDKDIFTVASMAQDSRRRLDLEEKSAEFKGKVANAKLLQKDRDFLLAEKKFRRETCELFLEWFSKETAKQIATSGATNAEKIEQLGLAMFGEDWKA